MVRLIDLERYIFNYSKYNICTNSASQSIPKNDFVKNNNLHQKKFLRNEFIFDNGIFAFMDPDILYPESFADNTEYNIMINIFMDDFVYDIKTFCQIMFTCLPIYIYMALPKNCKVCDYYIDLDDNTTRIIENDYMGQRYA